MREQERAKESKNIERKSQRLRKTRRKRERLRGIYILRTVDRWTGRDRRKAERQQTGRQADERTPRGKDRQRCKVSHNVWYHFEALPAVPAPMSLSLHSLYVSLHLVDYRSSLFIALVLLFLSRFQALSHTATHPSLSTPHVGRILHLHPYPKPLVPIRLSFSVCLLLPSLQGFLSADGGMALACRLQGIPSCVNT